MLYTSFSLGFSSRFLVIFKHEQHLFYTSGGGTDVVRFFFLHLPIQMSIHFRIHNILTLVNYDEIYIPVSK